MVAKEIAVQIVNLDREGWKVGTIAKQLGVHPDTVRRQLDKKKPQTEGAGDESRATVLEPWLPLIETTLEKYPTVRSTRLFSMIKQRGYTGSIYPLRRYCSKNRPRRTKAHLDLHFAPGEMAQVDWASFGKIAIGKHTRPLHLFLMVLAYSRKIYGRYFHDMSTARVLEGHVLAFDFFAGSTRQVLYDNMKTAVTEHIGEGVRFNSSLLELAHHYAFLPRACNPRSGWEKGRVERAVRYVRENFFEARKFDDLADLNRQLEEWLVTDASDRAWPGDRLLTVRDAFNLENLQARPSESFDPYEERTIRVDKKAMIHFDTNRYPVDPSYAGQNLILRANHSSLRIMSESKTLHCHPRLWCKHETLPVAGHQQEIAKQRKIKEHRAARSALERSLSCGRELLQRWAELGDSMQSSSKRVLELITQYGLENVTAACQLALENKTPRACSIAQIIAEGTAQPSTGIHLRMEADIPKLSLEWPSTADYDDLYQSGK